MSAHIFERLSGLLVRVMKIQPDVILRFFAYDESAFCNAFGIKTVLVLPLFVISICPVFTDSDVIYLSSLTRIPVAQMV